MLPPAPVMGKLVLKLVKSAVAAEVAGRAEELFTGVLNNRQPRLLALPPLKYRCTVILPVILLVYKLPIEAVPLAVDSSVKVPVFANFTLFDCGKLILPVLATVEVPATFISPSVVDELLRLNEASESTINPLPIDNVLPAISILTGTVVELLAEPYLPI